MFKITFGKEDKSKKNCRCNKFKKYRWKRFWSEFYAFFYNKEDHQIRKGPILLLFFVSIIIQLSIIGFTMALNYASGKSLIIKDLIAFFLLSILFSINLYSIVKFKKMATPTSFNIGNSFGSIARPTLNNKVNTPILGTGVPINKKILNGDNR